MFFFVSLSSVHLPPSSYPDARVKKDENGKEMGVIGSVSLLQNVTLATQPISNIDWNADKVGTALPNTKGPTILSQYSEVSLSQGLLVYGN